MKIVVCVKQVVHTYARTGMDPEKQFLAPEDRVLRMDPCDESAFALALRARGLAKGGEISALTLGPRGAQTVLRRCAAMGADSLYRIDMGDDLDPWQKSVFLARAIGEMKADLIFLGGQSMDRRNGQVAAFVARHANLPFVSGVRDMAISVETGSLRVERSAGRGVRELVECAFPAVLSVDEGAAEPPLPPFREKREGMTMPVNTIIYDRAGVAPKVVRKERFPPRPRPKQVPAPDPELEAFDRIGELFGGTRVEKGGEILTGPPESLVEGIVSFLDANGFLEGQAKDEEAS